ncbi:MAG: MarR family transcriptional regulator [Sneathiella sp.]
MSMGATQLYAVIRHLRPAFKHISKLVEIRSAEAGLTIGMRAVLEQLYEEGPKTVPDIARSLMVERQYIQRTANALMAEKLISRLPNPAHKKSWIFDLTEEGGHRFTSLKRREIAILQKIAKDLSASEIASAITVMSTLSETFNRLVKQEQHLSKGE